MIVTLKPVELYLLAFGLDRTAGDIAFLEAKQRSAGLFRLSTEEQADLGVRETGNGVAIEKADAEVERDIDANIINLCLLPFTGCKSWPGDMADEVLALRDKLQGWAVEAMAAEAWDKLPEEVKKRKLESQS